MPAYKIVLGFTGYQPRRKQQARPHVTCSSMPYLERTILRYSFGNGSAGHISGFALQDIPRFLRILRSLARHSAFPSNLTQASHDTTCRAKNSRISQIESTLNQNPLAAAMAVRNVFGILLLYSLAMVRALDCNAWKYDCPNCKPWQVWCDRSCMPKKKAAQAAANAFFGVTGTIEAACANDILNGNEHGRRIVEDAKSLLYEQDVFEPSDFDGIQIRFCSALGPFAAGMVPSSDKILLNGSTLNYSAQSMAVLLAHEMIHIQQHERWSSTGFGCRYQEELWSGHGFGKKNSVEKEAYDFDSEVRLRLRGTKVALQAHDGSYVTAIQGGGGAVEVKAQHVNVWEIFWLIRYEGGKVAFQTKNYHYLHATNGGGGVVTAQAPKALEWESFELELVSGGKYSLQAYNGDYLAAKNGGGDILEANRVEVGDWEKFRVVWL